MEQINLSRADRQRIDELNANVQRLAEAIEDLNEKLGE